MLVMALCAIIDFIFFRGGQRMVEHPFWSKVLIVACAGFFVLLAVVVPVQILVFERRERKGQQLAKLTIKDLIGLPFGAANSNAEIPKWVKIPVLSFLFFLLGVFVIFFVMLLATYLIFKIKGG
jgi:branched-subunit amino acid ABC-type transport system permease component